MFRRTHALLRERYPELFTASRPLAIGIYHQIRAAIGREELRSRDLSLFLAGWTKWPAYRAALARGDRRVNLDGSDAGPALAEPGGSVATEPKVRFSRHRQRSVGRAAA